MIIKKCRCGECPTYGWSCATPSHHNRTRFYTFRRIGRLSGLHGAQNKAGQQKHEIIEVTFAQQAGQRSYTGGRQRR